MSTQQLRKKMMEYQSVGGLLGLRTREYPDKIFLQFKGETYTYAELDLLANRAANGLQERGIQRGDKVSIMMKTCPEWLGIWFGCAKIGAVVCPVNTAYKGEGLAYQLRHSDSSLVVIDDAYVERLESIKDDWGIPKTIVVRRTGSPSEPRDEIVELSDLLDAPEEPPPAIELSP